MRGEDSGLETEPLVARLLLWLADELLCVGAGLGAMLGASALARHPPDSVWTLGVLAGTLAYAVVGCYTLSVYLQRRRVALRLAAQGEEPLRDLLRMALELQRLTLVQLASLALDVLKVSLILCCLGAFVLDDVVVAGVLFTACVALACRLDALGAYLRGKMERFYDWDGVVVLRADGEAPPRPRSWTTRLREGLSDVPGLVDMALDALLFPPVSLGDVESIRLQEADVRPSPCVPCRVCGEALGEGPVVACVSCLTPHHGDCFEYLGACAVYGCGGTRALSTETAEVAEEASA